MSKLLQVRIDDKLKADADVVFSSMGLDISAAVRMFLMATVETRRLPFAVRAWSLDAKDNNSENMAARPPFNFGSMTGKVSMADDFDAPLDDFEEYM
jgi:DNA-damage-inducible protein J